MGAHIERHEPEGSGPDLAEPVGIALSPILELSEGYPVAYEVRTRPAGRQLDPIELLRRVLSVVPQLRPGVVVVPLDRALSPELAAELARSASTAGVVARDIVWLVPAPGMSLLEGSRMVVAQSLVEQGFGVALESISLASAGRPEVLQLKPRFVLVDRHIVRRVDSDQAARATIAGLLAFFDRLGGQVVALGVDDPVAEARLIELGVKLGSGRVLSSTLVLDARLAEPGDTVVDLASLREVLPPGRPAAGASPGKLSEADGPSGVATSVPAERRSAEEAGADASDGDETVAVTELAGLLADMARALGRSGGAEQVFQAVFDALPGIVAIDRAVILEADWDAYRMVARAALGAGIEGFADLEDSLDSGITGSAFLGGRVHSCPDTDAEDEVARLPGAPDRVEESLVVVPLVVGDHRLGVLDVWRHGTHAFAGTDVERLELVGHLTAAAWQNAQLSEELERRSMTDSLTGLLNKRWWRSLSRREAAQAVRDGTEVAIVLVDLDHFGRINEALGHAVGDVVLRNVARALAGSVRTGDAALRYGSDEFLLLLHHGGAAAALRVAEGVRLALADLPSPSDEIGQLTASMGMALFPRHGENLEEVAEAAALAMKAARSAGRGMLELYGGP